MLAADIPIFPAYLMYLLGIMHNNTLERLEVMASDDVCASGNSYFGLCARLVSTTTNKPSSHVRCSSAGMSSMAI
jgi:hypothetical protein